METTTWVIQGILAFVFVMAGVMKLVQSREKIMASGGKWAEDFSANTIKLIGVGELLCGVGVVVPRLVGHGHMSTAVAAAGTMVFMAGASYTHVRRKELPFLALTGALFLMGAFVCYTRCPFTSQG